MEFFFHASIALALILFSVLISFYAERKFAAFIQDRMGPMVAGKFGTLQAFADLIKLFQKEEVIHKTADSSLYRLGPIIIFIAVFAGFAVLPIAPGFANSSFSTGLFYVLAIIALDVLGIVMAGWASNNKFSHLGAMRSASQVVSYELPLVLCILCVAVISGSLDLQEIALQQGIFMNVSGAYGDSSPLKWSVMDVDVSTIGGFLTWNIVRVPPLLLAMFVYYLASLAECNRAPFDLPEAESELVGGFHTEYAGFRWSIFFLSEYALMVLVAALGVVLFLGGWNTILPNIGPLKLADWTTGTWGTWTGFIWGAFWLISKTLLWVMTQIWLRWTFPRLKANQLMFMSWKVLLPLATILLLICATWRLFMYL